MVKPSQGRRSARPKRLDDPARVLPGELPHAEVDLSSADASSAPGMPNERDEKVGTTGGVPSGKVQQASRDVKRGLVDTSRAEATDAAYQRQKKPG